MKCLVVDESSLMRRILIRALASMGHRDVVEIPDGVEALQHCDESVGLVITDWLMPTMGGIELVRHLRANPVTANVPVIMVTARNSRENVQEALEAGVSGYLLKPVNTEILKRKIDELTLGDSAPHTTAPGEASADEGEAERQAA